MCRLKPKSEFTKNVLTLMTGTTIAQAIPVAVSPILTRLYTPEDFGVLALFVAITSILGSIANGRYELAIMLPRKDEDAVNVMALGFIINLALSSILFLIVVIFHDGIISLLNNEEISPWLYLVPISVFLMGCFNLLNYFNNRKKFYKDLAKANVYKAIGAAIVQLSFGFLKAGAFGLISGQIFSQIISNTKLFFNVKKLGLFKTIKTVKIIVLGKKYRDFLKFSTFHVLFNNLSSQVPIFILSIFFSLSITGYYSLVMKIVGVPIGILSKSISDVFFRECNYLKIYNKNSLTELYRKILSKLIILLLPFFFIFIFIAPLLFEYVFGKEWREGGVFLQILSPMLLLGGIGSVLSNIVNIFNKQKKGLILEILGFFFKVFSLSVGIFAKNVYLGLIFFSLSGASLTLYRLVWYYEILKEYENGF